MGRMPGPFIAPRDDELAEISPLLVVVIIILELALTCARAGLI